MMFERVTLGLTIKSELLQTVLSEVTLTAIVASGFLEMRTASKPIRSSVHVSTFNVNYLNVLKLITLSANLSILPCVSRIVAFIVKNINEIFFACCNGKPNSSPVKIKKNYGTIFKKTALAYAWTALV